MKKIIILIILLIVSFPCFAHKKGAGFYAELGKDAYTAVSYTEIEVHYNFIWNNFVFKPYGITKTWFLTEHSNKITAFRGNPFCDIYTIGMSVKYSGLSIFCEHNCAHRVYSNDELWQTKEYEFYGNSDIIGIRYQYN